MQAARFNDKDDKCKILVATDAIGMGLNLNIRRIIFYSLKKVTLHLNKMSKTTKRIMIFYFFQSLNCKKTKMAKLPPVDWN
jgi:superfamily II DNA/RNA helicase